MTYLAYYRIEAEKYRDLQQIGVSIEAARLMVSKLCREYGIPEVPISVNPKLKRKSFYRPPPRPKTWGLPVIQNPRHHRYHRPEEIVMAPTMMNWQVVAHELAHALHTHDYNRRWNEGVVTKERWHGPEHAAWMSSVCRRLRETVVPAPETLKKLGVELDFSGYIPLRPTAAQRRVYNAEARRRHLETLPATMLCPRCLLEKAREDFGTRVVKKSSGGLALKVIRQSYCKECR